MATKAIGFYRYLNKTESADKAKYLIKIVPNGVANLSDIVEDILKGISGTENGIKSILKEAFNVGIKYAKLGYTADIGGIRIKPRIPGSMPCEDTPFREGEDEFIIELYADSELDDTFEDVIPYELDEDALTSAIKVSNIMDVTSETFGLVDGNKMFVVLGNGVTLDGPSEHVKLVNKKTGEAFGQAEIKSVDKGQRAYCQFSLPTSVAEGDYSVEVATCGLIGEDTPRVFRKPVKYLQAEIPPAPTVTKLYSDDLESKVKPNAKILHVEGTNLGSLTKDNVVFKCEDTVVAIPTVATWTFTDTTITMDSPEALDIDGVTGDAFSVTISGEGYEPVIGTTTLA